MSPLVLGVRGCRCWFWALGGVAVGVWRWESAGICKRWKVGSAGDQLVMLCRRKGENGMCTQGHMSVLVQKG